LFLNAKKETARLIAQPLSSLGIKDFSLPFCINKYTAKQIKMQISIGQKNVILFVKGKNLVKATLFGHFFYFLVD
jgi:hypothetical protein